MIAPFSKMIFVPGGTSFLTLFGVADSSHFSSSLPSGVNVEWDGLADEWSCECRGNEQHREGANTHITYPRWP
jgi:hypothetical protein